MYDLALSLAKINLKAMHQSCGGDTLDNANALYYLLNKHAKHN